MACGYYERYKCACVMTAWDIRANLAVRNLKCSSVMTFRVIRGETRVLELKHVFKEP